MALYLIGDIQGCNGALQRMLQTIDFSPSRDTLYVLGDMVNRGEDSAGVLQTFMRLGSAVQCVLGNHDLHALAVAHGIRQAHSSDTLQTLLDHPLRANMLEWLRHQNMAIGLAWQSRRWLLVHAGVLPQWSFEQALALAQEVEVALRSSNYVDFLRAMYGNAPCQWSDQLTGWERLRVITNALTRLRFCDANGVMDFKNKGAASLVQQGQMPWFEVPYRKTACDDVSIAFGHWSTLGLWVKPHIQAPQLLGLDTGYVWGGQLTAYCLNSARLATISAPTKITSQAT